MTNSCDFIPRSLEINWPVFTNRKQTKCDWYNYCCITCCQWNAMYNVHARLSTYDAKELIQNRIVYSQGAEISKNYHFKNIIYTNFHNEWEKVIQYWAVNSWFHTWKMDWLNNSSQPKSEPPYKALRILHRLNVTFHRKYWECPNVKINCTALLKHNIVKYVV